MLTLFVIDVKRESIAISEASKMGIPIVAVVDTNSSPESVDYVIPGNDDSIRSISLFSRAISDACLEGSKLATGLKPKLEDEAGPAIIRSKSQKAETLDQEAEPEKKEKSESEDVTEQLTEEKPEPKQEESVQEDEKEKE